MKLRLEARVSSDSLDAVGRFLVAKFGATSVARDGNNWFVRAPGHQGPVPVVLRYGVMLGRAGQLAKRDGGYALRALRKRKKKSRKRKKGNPEKEKPRSKNKKDAAEKVAPSWRHVEFCAS